MTNFYAESFEFGVASYGSFTTNCIASQVAAPTSITAADGNYLLRMASVASGDMDWYNSAATPATAMIPVLPSTQYTLRCNISRSGGSTRTYRIGIDWYSGTTFLSSDTADLSDTLSWQLHSVTATSPAVADRARLHFIVLATGAANELHQLDAVAFNIGSDTSFPATTTPWLVATRGGDIQTISNTSHVTTLSSPTAIAVDNYLIAHIGVSNSNATGAAPLLSAADSVGNIWTVIGPSNVNPAGQNSGSAAYIAFCRVVNTYPGGSTVTMTYADTSVGVTLISEWNGIHLTAPIAVAPTTSTGTASSAVSLAITPYEAGQMVLAVCSLEGQSTRFGTVDADTTNGTWLELIKNGTNTGGDTTSTSVYGTYKVVTASGAQTWDNTLGAALDWASIAVVINSRFGGSPPGAATTTTRTNTNFSGRSHRWGNR